MTDPQTDPFPGDRTLIPMTPFRAISAMVGWLLLFAFIIHAPSWGITCLAVGGSLLSGVEVTRLLSPHVRWTALLGGAGAATSTLAFHPRDPWLALYGVTAVGLCLCAAALTQHRLGAKPAVDGIFGPLVALIYVAIPLGFLILLDGIGRGWVTLALASTYARDLAAFLTGRITSGRCIAPLINPRKTWIGGIGGVIGTAISLVALHYLGVVTLTQTQAVILTLWVGVFGQWSDLFESMLKRHGGAKDSGGVIPGHGGMLDAIDGLLLSTPMIYAVAQ